MATEELIFKKYAIRVTVEHDSIDDDVLDRMTVEMQRIIDWGFARMAGQANLLGLTHLGKSEGVIFSAEEIRHPLAGATD